MTAQDKRRYVPATRIVCTLGPASSDETVLRKMMRAGMDIVRLNFSHGNWAGHASRLQTVRTLNRKYRRRLRALGDLEGPRVRLGYFRDRRPVLIERNQTVRLVPMQDRGDGQGRFPFDYEGAYSDLSFCVPRRLRKHTRSVKSCKVPGRDSQNRRPQRYG